MENVFKNQISLPSLFEAIDEREKLRIIRLKGSIDVSKALELEEFVKKFRGQKGFEFKHILLDFSAVTFLDSSAVAAVIKTMLDYKKTNHQMGIINSSKESRNQSILEVYKVDSVVHFYSSEAEATKELEKD